jgi:hypothetical protein
VTVLFQGHSASISLLIALHGQHPLRLLYTFLIPLLAQSHRHYRYGLQRDIVGQSIFCQMLARQLHIFLLVNGEKDFVKREHSTFSIL